MRNELDYIKDDPAALRWALGCVLASYRTRLAGRWGFTARTVWRHAAASSALVFFVGFAFLQTAGGQTEPLQPLFSETACELPDVTPELRPRLRCGTVDVPRNYEHRDAGSFKLAVVVIKSELQPSWPEPVVYISSGPGNPLTVYAAYQSKMPYAPHRDLILVDQRGTGRSEPSICPDLDRKLLDANFAIAVTNSEAALSARRADYAACRDRGCKPRP
jgi:hypothetical protein